MSNCGGVVFCLSFNVINSECYLSFSGGKWGREMKLNNGLNISQCSLCCVVVDGLAHHNGSKSYAKGSLIASSRVSHIGKVKE